MKQVKQRVPFEQVVQNGFFVCGADTDVTLCLTAFSFEGSHPISRHVTNN